MTRSVPHRPRTTQSAPISGNPWRDISQRPTQRSAAHCWRCPKQFARYFHGDQRVHCTPRLMIVVGKTSTLLLHTTNAPATAAKLYGYQGRKGVDVSGRDTDDAAALLFIPGKKTSTGGNRNRQFHSRGHGSFHEMRRLGKETKKCVSGSRSGRLSFSQQFEMTTIFFILLERIKPFFLLFYYSDSDYTRFCFCTATFFAIT